MRANELIYDWNVAAPARKRPIQFCDETLRDGLQGHIARMPSHEERLELLTHTARLGIAESVIGFPAQESAFRMCLGLCLGAQKRGLDLRLGMLGRLVREDIEAIARIRDKSGQAVTAWLFVGASPIRRYVEHWNTQELEELAAKGLGLARELGLPVNFGIEDATRAEPEVVERLIRVGAEQKIETVTPCDTVGHLTPEGTSRLVRHFRAFLDENGFGMRLDFHGHRDRGLGLANALAAVHAGIDRLHATILGVGERSGNFALELLLVNLKIMGLWEGDLSPLLAYCEDLARYTRLPVPENHPVFGASAFRTQAGIHAAAIHKAESLGQHEIASLVYSSVDPSMVGLDYSIQVGPASGRSNVRFVLGRRGMEANEDAIDEILKKARVENRVLRNEEVYDLACDLMNYDRVKDMGLVDMWEDSCSRYPERTALVGGDERISYSRARQLVDEAAAQLRRLGVGRGVKVALFFPNEPGIVIALFAVLKTGAIACPVNPNVSQRELDQIMQVVQPHLGLVGNLPAEWKDRLHGDVPLADFRHLRLQPAQVRVQAEWEEELDQVAAILCSSGTTGVPKAGMLTHGNLVSNTFALRANKRWQEHEVFGNPLPLFHPYGITVMTLLPLSMGGTVVLMPPFTPQSCLETIEHERMTLIAGVPSMFTMLNKYRKREQYDFSSIHAWVCGGAPLSGSVIDEFSRKYGALIYEGYGMLETSPGITWNLDDRPYKWGSVGRPLEGVEVQIRDEDGTALGEGHLGEVWVRSAGVMKGYYRDPETTGEMIQNGWINTGDMGRMGEDGYLYLMGRKKELMIVGGHNVYPREIETVLLEDRRIADAAVAAQEDSLKGDMVFAFVVPVNGYEVDDHEILSRCRRALSPFKVPRRVFTTTGIPRNDSGKILRQELLKQMSGTT